VFDEDPKRWRLIAEGFTTTGRALEIATAVFPQNFVLLAGVRVSLSTAPCFGSNSVCQETQSHLQEVTCDKQAAFPVGNCQLEQNAIHFKSKLCGCLRITH